MFLVLQENVCVCAKQFVLDNIGWTLQLCAMAFSMLIQPKIPVYPNNRTAGSIAELYRFTIYVQIEMECGI